MKTLFNSAKILLITSLLMCAFTSCKENTEKPKDTKEVAEDKNEAQLDQMASEDDEAKFFVDIAAIGLTEIELAKLAEKKATHSGVKEYAKMLIRDHEKSNAELKSLAENRSLTIPTSLTDKGKEDYQKLNEKYGLEFDKKFVDMMIDDHEKAIRKMENASEDNDKDQSIKVWASNKIATLTSHLQDAKMLKEKLDVK